MNLLTVIPEEVIEGCILPYLGWNDLLRFRRVCRDITNGFVRTHPELAPWIEINEEDKNFRAFLEMGIPTTKIFLNNGSIGYEFYEKDDEDIFQFLQKYGSLVKYLHVGQVSMFIHGKEWGFMEGLVNLEEFQAGFFGFGRISHSREDLQLIVNKALQNAKLDPRHSQAEVPLPSVFKLLKALKIGQNKHSRINCIILKTKEFFDFAKELELVSMPFNTAWSPHSLRPESPEVLREPTGVLLFAFLIMRHFLKKRGTESQGKVNLKVLDFLNYHNLTDLEVRSVIPVGSKSFLELCADCLKHDVKLWNVDPRWFQARNRLNPELRSPDLGIPVVSLVGLSPEVFPLNMPHLEKIVIKATSTSNLGPESEWRRNRPSWPALKHLEITVDYGPQKFWIFGNLNASWVSYLIDLNTIPVFQFFFQDVQRKSLAELHLDFSRQPGEVGPPITEEIVASCPNLKKLTLVNWPGTNNNALSTLWSGLLHLEEVSLENCKELENVAFVGEDLNDPVFLKLTKLRKLRLKGLDKMPKITDSLFSRVLCHMKLSHFIVTSCSPVTSVTAAGVLSLLQGKFS